MNMKKQTMIPALLLGLTLAGAGGVAFADVTPGQLPAAVLSKFTAAQQTAITQAHDIRAKADVEAKAVLTAAGLTEKDVHTAMESYRDTERKAIDTALTNNDYSAFTTAIANMPDASAMTPEIFAKLVKIHSLEASGDRAGAMALRQELRDSGFKGVGIGMMGGRGHDHNHGMGDGRGHGLRFDDDTMNQTPAPVASATTTQ